MTSALPLPRSVRAALLLDRLGHPAGALAMHDEDEPHTLGQRPFAATVAAWDDVQLVWAVLPTPGDPQGLGPAVLGPAVAAGEALVVQRGSGTLALVPDVVAFGSHLEPGHLVRWRALEADGARPPATTPGEARTALHEAMTEAIEELTRLDVARERPDLREAFLDLAGPPGRAVDALVADLDERRAQVLLRALRLLGIVALATQDDGAAVTAGQVQRRSDALRDLERAARLGVAVGTLRPLR